MNEKYRQSYRFGRRSGKQGPRPLSRNQDGVEKLVTGTKTRTTTRTMTSDGFANCPSIHGGIAQCPNGTFSRSKHRNRQHQCKLNIGTWNITSLTGKEIELTEEARKYQLDILGISSTKRKGKGTFSLNDGWQLFYSGIDPATHAQAGVSILLHPRLADAVLDWKPINERVALIRLQLKKIILTIIQVYAPNTEADYETFLNMVLTAMESVPKTDSILLIGYFNAHVGNDSQTWSSVIGRNGDRDLNNQGRKLLDLCASCGLSIMNTFFQYKDIHKYTWYKTEDSMVQRSLIDFIIVSDNLRRTVMNVRVKRDAELATDHHLVVSILELLSNDSIRKIKPKKNYRIKWEALADEETRRSFAKIVDQRCSQLPPMEVDIESEWHLFKMALVDAATTTCGIKRVRIQYGQKKTTWWNEEIRNVICEKKIAYHKWIQQPTTKNWQNYKQIRDKTKKLVSEAKAKSWENFRHQLEHNHHSANKLFWQTIRRLHKGGQKPIRSVKDTSGRLLTQEEDILNRWKEYFTEFYNPTSGQHTKSSELIDDESNDISATEVTATIKSLKSGKAAGVDEIRPEMLKSLNSGDINWLTRICRLVWKIGKVPMEWQIGIVVPIFKKGDQKECSNYRGITLIVSSYGDVSSRLLEQ